MMNHKELHEGLEKVDSEGFTKKRGDQVKSIIMSLIFLKDSAKELEINIEDITARMIIDAFYSGSMDDDGPDVEWIEVTNNGDDVEIHNVPKRLSLMFATKKDRVDFFGCLPLRQRLAAKCSRVKEDGEFYLEITGYREIHVSH